jgi:hypothetical protein
MEAAGLEAKTTLVRRRVILRKYAELSVFMRIVKLDRFAGNRGVTQFFCKAA